MHKGRLSGQSAIPRHKQVLDTLLADIRGGKYEPGQKLPSETALSQRFGTSRITIGRALRELKQRGLVRGVAGSGNFVKAANPGQESSLFGLLIPNLGESEIFEPICRGMAAATAMGMHALLWGHTNASHANLEEQALELCRQYVDRKVAGVFFAPLEWTPAKDRVNAEICALLDAARIPVILLDRCILPYPQRSRYDLVGIDNRRAGYYAAEHLLQMGCTDIAFLAMQGAAPTVEARIAGYREALLNHGVDPRPARLQRVSAITPETVAAALQNSACHSFVCANDRVAGEFLRVLQDLGRRVPQEVRVVGIDDVEYAALLPIPLTTVHQPCRAIGEAAVDAMLVRRERPEMPPRDILLDCRLVIRKSSGA